MSSIAFEVYLNGERRYTAGADEWQSIFAHVLAQRIDPAVAVMLAQGGEKPSDEDVDTKFRTAIHVPSGEAPTTGSDGLQYTQTKAGSYPSFSLSEGDVVEIRVVRTTSPDAPEWVDRDRARNVVIKSTPE